MKLEMTFYESEQEFYIDKYAEEQAVRFKNVNSSKIDTNKLYICTDEEINSNDEYQLLFLDLPFDKRKRVYQAGDLLTPDGVETVYKVCFDYLKGLAKTAACNDWGIKYGINLSFGDYCLLIPKGKETDMIQVKKLLNEYCSSDDIWEKGENLKQVKREILKRIDTQHSYSYLPYRDYRKIISSILETNVDTEEKAWSCARNAVILLHILLAEVRMNFMFANGEYKEQNMTLVQDYSKSLESLHRSVEKFSKQCSDGNCNADIIWSYLFLTDAMLAANVGRVQDEKSEKYDEYIDFRGFLPVVSADTKALSSESSDQYMPIYTLAFLSIPQNTTYLFETQLPPLVHEFSHCTIPKNRRLRNRTTLRLTFQAVMNPLRGMGGERFNQLISRMLENYYHLVKRINPDYKGDSEDNEKDKENKSGFVNSMAFLDENAGYIDSIAFVDLLNERIDSGRNLIGRYEELSTYYEECEKNWNTYASSYLVTFMMALREIRSDIAMCAALDIDLDEYITIMARESEWANSQAEQTADSVILRFGFMTKYLSEGFKKENKDARKTVEDQIEKNKKACQNKGITVHLKNMSSYINRYYSLGNDEFERELYEGAAPCTLIGMWKDEFKDSAENWELYKSIRKIYKMAKSKADDAVESRLLKIIM